MKNINGQKCKSGVLAQNMQCWKARPIHFSPQKFSEKRFVEENWTLKVQHNEPISLVRLACRNRKFIKI